MLLSMTGYGDAQRSERGISVSVEIRSINNRYFKLSIRGSDHFPGWDSRIEALARKFVTRGTVSINLRVRREADADAYKIDEQVLEGYLRQLREAGAKMGLHETPHIDSLLSLPGVVREVERMDEGDSVAWEVTQAVLTEALEKLDTMRKREGESTAVDLRENCQIIATWLEQVAERSPLVVSNYRARTTDRINKVLEEFQVSADDQTLIKEVAIFADRIDISEEIVRLTSHLKQFATFLADPSSGRKLDFLTQEMFRETNTIGSKANDAEIAKYVVEMKTAIERIREQIQNIE
ncbi:MAG: YicC/YloC family endoribonuclease [Pirellulaceae bacterium]